MPVIPNSWIEKERKKKAHETAPAYESRVDEFNAKKPVKRFSYALRASIVKTLRGVRK